MTTTNLFSLTLANHWQSSRVGQRTQIPVVYLFEILDMLRKKKVDAVKDNYLLEMLDSLHSLSRKTTHDKLNDPSVITDDMVNEIETLLQGIFAADVKAWNEFRDDKGKLQHVEEDVLLAPWDWFSVIQQKYLEENLANKLRRCFLPPLPPSMVHSTIGVGPLYEALQVLQADEENHFKIFSPISAGAEPHLPELMNLYSEDTLFYGWVFNTSPHPQHGSHWVGMLYDVEKNQFEYYDSMGSNAPPLIIKSASLIGGMLFDSKLFPALDNSEKARRIRMIYNDKQVQFGGIECGVYVMRFMFLRIMGRELSDFYDIPFPDASARELRSQYWSLKPHPIVQKYF